MLQSQCAPKHLGVPLFHIAQDACHGASAAQSQRVQLCDDDGKHLWRRRIIFFKFTANAALAPPVTPMCDPVWFEDSQLAAS